MKYTTWLAETLAYVIQKEYVDLQSPDNVTYMINVAGYKYFPTNDVALTTDKTTAANLFIASIKLPCKAKSEMDTIEELMGRITAEKEKVSDIRKKNRNAAPGLYDAVLGMCWASLNDILTLNRTIKQFEFCLESFEWAEEILGVAISLESASNDLTRFLLEQYFNVRLDYYRNVEANSKNVKIPRKFTDEQIEIVSKAIIGGLNSLSDEALCNRLGHIPLIIKSILWDSSKAQNRQTLKAMYDFQQTLILKEDIITRPEKHSRIIVDVVEEVNAAADGNSELADGNSELADGKSGKAMMFSANGAAANGATVTVTTTAAAATSVAATATTAATSVAATAATAAIASTAAAASAMPASTTLAPFATDAAWEDKKTPQPNGIVLHKKRRNRRK